MLRLTTVFVALALVTAVFAFGPIFSYSSGVPRMLFFIFMVLAVLSVCGVAYRKREFLN
jgi:uncharacterized membrane protein YtjA (UPF0391 family)